MRPLLRRYVVRPAPRHSRISAARIRFGALLILGASLGLQGGCVSGEIIPARNDEPTLAPPTGGAEVMVGEVAIDPGRVVAHRLNRVEYNNTLRDLFYGLDLRPADAFPVDNFAEGFDNNAQELRMSNLLFEKYLEAADKIVAGGVRQRRRPRPPAAACDLGQRRRLSAPGARRPSPSGPSAGR